MTLQAPPVADVRPLVDAFLADALTRRVSDIHVEPTVDGYELRLRIDGLLEINQKFDPTVGRAIVTRLMVMAKLLTYRLDVPQEGRVSFSPERQTTTAELRLSVMPTIHGMRAALRMPADHVHPAILEDLSMPPGVLTGLLNFAAADSGMLIVTGPAGSGKTTTIYALLRQVAKNNPGLSIIALEDPVERAVPGVTQIEVSPFGQLTYEKALRSILRQDPQVLMLGEVRDAATASLAIQAALSGHRLITAFHAATPAGALARLLEMGIEPYQLTSTIHGIVAQRLFRQKSPDGHTYHGRLPLAEYVAMDAPLKQAILSRADADTLANLYQTQPAYRPMSHIGQGYVEKGLTDKTELNRVLGSQPRTSSPAEDRGKEA